MAEVSGPTVDVRALALALRVLRLGLATIVTQLEDGSLAADVEAQYGKVLAELGHDLHVHAQQRQADTEGGTS